MEKKHKKNIIEQPRDLKMETKIKLPQKGAGKALKEIYEKKRSSVKASLEL